MKVDGWAELDQIGSRPFIIQVFFGQTMHDVKVAFAELSASQVR